jgi:hypothetical protein
MGRLRERKKFLPIFRLARNTPRLQGAYYVASGLWPLIDMRSFEAVTGPKHDRWLVKTVGALVTVIGATLLLSGRGRRPGADAANLGMLSALALIGVDTIFTATEKIPPIYLADAAVETAIVAGWMLAPGQIASRVARTETNPQTEYSPHSQSILT